MFKNEEQLLLEIIGMLRLSLRHLILADNDLRSFSPASHSHFKFIEGLRKILMSDPYEVKPLLSLDLRHTRLVPGRSDEEELEHLRYLQRFKEDFDRKQQQPTKLELKIV